MTYHDVSCTLHAVSCTYPDVSCLYHGCIMMYQVSIRDLCMVHGHVLHQVSYFVVFLIAGLVEVVRRPFQSLRAWISSSSANALGEITLPTRTGLHLKTISEVASFRLGILCPIFLLCNCCQPFRLCLCSIRRFFCCIRLPACV